MAYISLDCARTLPIDGTITERLSTKPVYLSGTSERISDAFIL